MDQDRAQILLVDDDPTFRQLLRRRLLAAGISCDEACDGQQALQMFAARSYPMVITDLRMPHVNGHCLCVELQQRSDAPELVVVTGVHEPRLEADLRQRGVRAIFTKPFALHEFTDRIREVLTQRQQEGARCDPLAHDDSTSSVASGTVVLEPALPTNSMAQSDLNAASLPNFRSTDVVQQERPLPSTVVEIRTISEVILWPTLLFALGTAFGWALHLISTTVLLRW